MPDPAPPPAADQTSGVLARWFVRGWLGPHHGRLAIAFVVMMIEGSTLGALAFMLEPLFDRVFTSGGNAALLGVGLLILGLFVLRAATAVISRTLMTNISQKIATTMQTDLLRHILRLDGAFFQIHPPGALIERVQGDTLAVQGIWTSVLTGVARDLVALIGLFAVALSIDPVWTLAALVGAPLLIVPALLMQRYLRRKSNQLREEAGLRATRLDEIFHGIQAVKLNRMEGYQTDRFRRILGRIVRAETRAAAGRAMMPGMIDIVTGLGFFAVLLLGGREVAAGSRTVGEFMAFFTAMALTFQPLRRLGDLAGLWQTAAASLQRIHALFATRPSQSRPDTSRALPAPGAPGIRFDAVTFAYGDTPVLRGLSFSAPAGGMTALVGPSGAGKSTVFHLLTGLSDPASGQITIGGAAVPDMSLADQRALFASVSQDAALFDETLRENILLGRDAPDTLDTVLRAALVTDFVAALPQGLDTPAGPRGSALSGGQRQRIAIARALLQGAPVLLLDEATSALDAQSEAAVACALRAMSAGRTTLVIAHRLATVREADLIVVMDRGRVVQSGTHCALLAEGGLYADLHRLQFKV